MYKYGSAMEGSCLISSVSSFISYQETGVTGAYVSHLSSSLPRPLFKFFHQSCALDTSVPKQTCATTHNKRAETEVW